MHGSDRCQCMYVNDVRGAVSILIALCPFEQAPNRHLVALESNSGESFVIWVKVATGTL